MKENCSVTKFSPDLSYFVIVPFENFAITKKKDLGNLFDWLFLPAYTLYFFGIYYTKCDEQTNRLQQQLIEINDSIWKILF